MSASNHSCWWLKVTSLPSVLNVILSRFKQVIFTQCSQFGSTPAWKLVGVEVTRLFRSLISQRGRDVEETRPSDAITACVDTFEAVADRCPGIRFESSNSVECETCSPDLAPAGSFWQFCWLSSYPVE